MKTKFFFIALFFSSTYISQLNAQEEQTEALSFNLVESKAVWPGCETEVTEELRFNCLSNSIMQYISKNVEYPKKAIKKNIQGRVYVQFIIEIDGSISSVELSRGVHPLLDEASLKVIRDMDVKFIPAMQKGKPVRMSFTIPINYTLKDSKKSKKRSKNKGIEI